MRNAVGAAFAAAVLFPAAAVFAQVVQLEGGQVLIAKVIDAHEGGLEVQRLDNGGVLDLTWDQLSDDSATRIKTAWNLSVEEEGELMVPAEVFRFELSSGGREEVIGRVVAQDGTTITVRRQGMNYPIQRARVRHRAQVEVPASDVYTAEEFYNEKLAEVAPGEDADKHIVLADILTRARDYERAEAHLQKARDLGTSKQQSTLEGKLERLGMFKVARAEREHLDKIGVALAREEFARGKQLLEEFAASFPDSKLEQEFLATQQRFLKARERHLLSRVSEVWTSEISNFAERKAAQVGLAWEAAKEYAEEGMGKDIREVVQKKLAIEAGELEELWGSRLADGQRKPRAMRYSFGVGSWTLGSDAIIKDTVASEQEAAQAGAGNEDMERMVERIRKATERARRALQNQPGGPKEDTPEAWWEAATRDEKKVFLRAYYAQFGGDMEVVSAHLDPCVTCTGDGSLTHFGQSGKAEKVECPTCHGTRFKRWIRAH